MDISTFLFPYIEPLDSYELTEIGISFALCWVLQPFDSSEEAV